MDKNTKLMVIDAVTGEVTERPFTDAELAERKLILDAAQEYQAEQDAKVEARKSALAKLAALGLTADEVAAL